MEFFYLLVTVSLLQYHLSLSLKFVYMDISESFPIIDNYLISFEVHVNRIMKLLNLLFFYDTSLLLFIEFRFTVDLAYFAYLN